MLGILLIKPKHLVVSRSGDPFSYDGLSLVVRDLEEQGVHCSEIGMNDAASRGKGPSGFDILGCGAYFSLKVCQAVEGVQWRH